MHAISKDTSSFPQACIYLQLDEDEEDAMMAGAGSDGEEEEEAHGEDEDVPAEVRLVLADMEKSRWTPQKENKQICNMV